MTERTPVTPFALRVLLVAILLCGSSIAVGGDHDGKEFGARLPSAFVRFTEVSAFGGETVANRQSSAINPASLGWMRLLKGQTTVAAPYYSRISFDEGTCLNLYGESLTHLTEDHGAFQPVLSQIRSNTARDRDDVEFGYRVDIAQIQWGKRFDDLAIGFTLNYNEVDIRQDRSVSRAVSIEVPKMPVPLTGVGAGNADTQILASACRFRIGTLYELSEKWMFGLVVEYGFSRYRTRTDVEGEIVWDSPVVPPEPMAETRRDRGDEQQILARPGVSYEYADLSTVYFDYSYGSFWGDAGDAMFHRFSLGADHRLLDWLWVRGNVGIDVEGQAGGSIGAGVYFSEWGSLDLGYLYNTLPELHPELGRDQSLQVTLSIRF